MASKTTSSSVAFFLALNLLYFTFVSACGSCPSPVPRPRPTPSPSPVPRPRPTPSPSPVNPSPVTPSPARGTCPRDTLKLGVCANVLGGLLNVTVGTPPVAPCCTLIQGLADLEAALCLCTAIKANILGINLNIPLSLSLLLNVCSKNVPSGFQCP
ncbi:hypothetical protein TIFTF001_003816 [Ficus carica]|uniref:Bifunctional inhibitor/plant lipid transfer protein/seed storage helical domain-containing protein n=1 Tax=Ficus carica TaxID=3494 RepID=A0AA88CUV2_FICCA|nr:hypothetical protein TIFTF001_003816 [Ficus carica]